MSKITAEWTEACRSGNCVLCAPLDDNDEVLMLDIGETASFILCPKCAAELIKVLKQKGIRV